jgi:hypothetical protein
MVPYARWTLDDLNIIATLETMSDNSESSTPAAAAPAATWKLPDGIEDHIVSGTLVESRLLIFVCLVSFLVSYGSVSYLGSNAAFGYRLVPYT